MLSSPGCRWVSPVLHCSFSPQSQPPLLSDIPKASSLSLRTAATASLLCFIPPLSLLLQTGSSAILFHLAHSSSFTAWNEGFSVTVTLGPLHDHILDSTHSGLSVQLPPALTGIFLPYLLVPSLKGKRELESWCQQDAKYILSYTGEGTETYHQQLGCCQTTLSAYFGEG